MVMGVSLFWELDGCQPTLAGTIVTAIPSPSSQITHPWWAGWLRTMGGLFSTHRSHFCFRAFLVLSHGAAIHLPLCSPLPDIHVSCSPLYSRLLRHFHRGDSLVIPCACSLWGRTLLQNSHILFLARTVAVHQSCRTSFWMLSETWCAPPQHPDHTQRSPTEWHKEATLHAEALRGKSR